jgi:hypothetical protein
MSSSYRETHGTFLVRFDRWNELVEAEQDFTARGMQYSLDNQQRTISIAATTTRSRDGALEALKELGASEAVPNDGE